MEKQPTTSKPGALPRLGAYGAITIQKHALHVTADGRRILVLHGDELDTVVQNIKWLAFLGDVGYQFLLALNPVVNAVRRVFGFGYWSLSIATLKLIFGFLLAICLLSATAPAQDPGNYRTVYVPPPVGSHLGGGYVRVPIENQGNDESALLGMITKLNAAGGEKRERQFVLEAVSRSTGVSQRELQTQQDILRLRFGDLCAINAISRGNSDKVHQIATLRSKGSSWTQLANANGVSIAMVVQTARNADQLTVSSFSNSVDRANGGPDRLKNLGIHAQPNVAPGN